MAIALATFLAWPGTAPCAADEFVTTIKTATNGTVRGRLVEFSLDQGLVLEPDDAGARRRFPARDVVEVITDHRSTAPNPDLVRVELVQGDVLFGRVTGGGQDSVALETDMLGTIAVPLERILLWKAPSAAYPEYSSAMAKLLEDRGDDDALLLANGDVVRGLVVGIDSHGFVLQSDSGASRLAHDSVIAAALASVKPAPANQPAVRILTTDGQRLTASQLDWSGSIASALVFEGVTVRIPGDRIARLDILGGRWEWLDALQPISYEHTPALGLPWTLTVNRNVTGGPIRVAGQGFEHGLGVHSESSITFDLRGEYRELVTAMGLDDHSGPYANVDVEIRVVGQLRFDRQGITPGTLHGPVRLDVAGAKWIKLTVLFGANADLQDRFDWVEAALVR